MNNRQVDFQPKTVGTFVYVLFRYLLIHIKYLFKAIGVDEVGRLGQQKNQLIIGFVIFEVMLKIAIEILMSFLITPQ